MTPTRWLASGVFGLVMGAAQASDSSLEHLQVTQTDDRFTLAARAWVAGPPEWTFSRLTDFDHLNTLNDSVQTSERLGGGSGEEETRVRVVSEGCVLFFCRTLRQEQLVTAREHDFVETRFLPEAGDFRDGRMTWQLSREAREGRTGTRIEFDGFLEPDFALPPAIGGYLARRQLEREIRTTVKRLGELNARALEAAEEAP